jgi:4-amino-4-deoxy-L-arabinose transferase-like glycosyltransferase
LLALIVLYFIAKQLFGARLSLWGVLILILLPKPAEYGSDALSDWPHLFFLVTGLLLLLKAGLNEKWWLFGFVGFAAGAGYLIRPECAQLVVLGSLWLGLQLLLPEHTMGKGRALTALALLLVGFLAIAGPYMNLKGAVFPKKNVGQFTQSLEQPEVNAENNQTISEAALTSQFTPSNIAKAFGKLVENIGETLMWFFVPALLIGMYKRLKTLKWYEPEKFFVIAVIALNIPVMIWLYCKHGYMSDRHTLPLLIIPILYVPVGLQELAIWCHKRFSRKVESSTAINRNERFWFLVLLLIGVSVCTPKLFRPIRTEKQGYRAAAEWLKANTDSAAIVAVPDKRISFYAERRELVYENENIPEKAEYIVKMFKKQKDGTALMESSDKVEYKYVNKKKRGFNVIIYKNL